MERVHSQAGHGLLQPANRTITGPSAAGRGLWSKGPAGEARCRAGPSVHTPHSVSRQLEGLVFSLSSGAEAQEVASR